LNQKYANRTKDDLILRANSEEMLNKANKEI